MEIAVVCVPVTAVTDATWAASAPVGAVSTDEYAPISLVVPFGAAIEPAVELSVTGRPEIGAPESSKVEAVIAHCAEG